MSGSKRICSRIFWHAESVGNKWDEQQRDAMVSKATAAAATALTVSQFRTIQETAATTLETTTVISTAAQITAVDRLGSCTTRSAHEGARTTQDQ